MSFEDFIVLKLTGLLALFGAGLAIGAHLESRAYESIVASKTPISAHYVDVNADKRQDIVLKNEAGNLTIFLQQEDGKYLRLEHYVSAQTEKFEYQLARSQDELTSRTEAIVQTARSYVKSASERQGGSE